MYYLNKPENSGGRRLMVHHAPNEIVPNLFSADNDERISLVADIAVMLKEHAECEKFMPDFSHWKKI